MKISPINSVQHVKMTVILNQAVHMKNGEKTEKKRVEGLNLNNLEKLKELVPEFGESKNLSDMYKKQSEACGNEIKKIMGDLVISHFTAGGYKVTRSVSNRETLNEDLLLEILKQSKCPDNIIKLKEYVDMDALERAIYNSEIPQDTLLAMEKARESKQVVTLRLSKSKKGDTDVY